MAKHRARRPDYAAILSIVVGLIVIIWPNILAVAVGLYLVIIGLLRLINK